MGPKAKCRAWIPGRNYQAFYLTYTNTNCCPYSGQWHHVVSVVTKVADEYATSAFGVEYGDRKLLQNSGKQLALIVLMWRIWWAPNNASKWQMGFNSAFKGSTGYMVAPPRPEFKVQPSWIFSSQRTENTDLLHYKDHMLLKGTTSAREKPHNTRKCYAFMSNKAVYGVTTVL